MTEHPRRSFMKRSATLVSGLTLQGCVPDRREPEPSASRAELEARTLEALGNVVLPATALGEPGVARVLEGFRKWLQELEPVAELDHPYIWTDEILYGPPDPGPLWNAQLEGLELEAEKRHGASFGALSREEHAELVKRQLPRDLPARLPEPARAPHVALGLLAYFYQTSEANDLGYEAAIERHTCRGLETSPDEPSPRRS